MTFRVVEDAGDDRLMKKVGHDEMAKASALACT